MFWGPTKPPLNATVEILSGIVRCGPHHHQYGDPYEYAVAFSSVDGKTATLKALVRSPGTALSPSHAKTAVRLLRDAYGLEARWERMKNVGSG